MAKSNIKPYTEEHFKEYNWDRVTFNKGALAEFISNVTSCCCQHDDVVWDCETVGCPIAPFRKDGEDTCDRDAIMNFLCAERRDCDV